MQQQKLTADSATMEGIEYSKSELTDADKSWLLKYNLIAGVLHLIQAIMQLILGLTVDNFKNFKLPLRLYYLANFETPDGVEYLDVDYDSWGNVAIAPLVSIFFFLSAVAHFAVVLQRESYYNMLARGINYYRWWEYAFSSSFMIIIIAQLFGVYDIASLFLIFTSNFTTQFMGLMMEEFNDRNSELNWTPFLVGCLTGFSPWVAIAFYFFGSGPSPEIPSFVYVVFISYLVFFNTFPLNMILQYKQVGRWKDYLFGEQVYILLSLGSKTLLGWLVFGGVNQPNKYTE